MDGAVPASKEEQEMARNQYPYRVVEVKCGDSGTYVEAYARTLDAARAKAERFDRALRSHSQTALINYYVQERGENGKYRTLAA